MKTKKTSAGAVSQYLGKKFVRSIRFKKLFDTIEGTPGFVVTEESGDIVVTHHPSARSAAFTPSYGSSYTRSANRDKLRAKLSEVECRLFLDAYAEHLKTYGLVVKNNGITLLVSRPENVLETLAVETA